MNEGLMEYRNTPISNFPYSPNQMLFSRQIRTRVPVHPLALYSHKLSREKFSKPTARQKKGFFARNLARNINKFISVRIVVEMTFSGYFFLRGQRESQMTKSRRTQALHNNLFKIFHFGAINQLISDN